MTDTCRFPDIVPNGNKVSVPSTPNRSSASHESSPTPVLTAVDSELQQLKQKLRDQTQRLSASPHRHGDGAQTSRSSKSRGGVAGSQYAPKPYQRVVPKQMWEPSFSTDVDVALLSERLAKSEERLAERKRQMEVQWAHGRPMIARTSVDLVSGTSPAFSPRPPSSGRVVHPAGDQPAAPAAAPTSRPPSAPFAPSLPQLKDNTDDEIPSFVISSEPRKSHHSAKQVSVHDSVDSHDHAHGMLSSGDVSSVLRRRTSSVKVSQGTIAMLRMLQGRPDIVLPCPKETGFERNGDVLTRRHILKQDLFESAFTRRDQLGVMSGAPYFRMVPKFHIGGVAQAHIHGIRTALNELRKAQSYGPILWINLREEPLVYLNQRSHIIRSADNPLKPAIIPNISGHRITRMEEKLKLEILAEAQNNGGNVCVHRESANGAIDEQWEAVEDEDLLTIEEIFQRLNEQGMNVFYQRRPVTQGLGPQASDFQFVIDLCEQHPEAPIIFNCQTGRGRSSLMMLTASIVRFYQMCTQDIDADVTLLRGDGKANNFRTLQKLISLLPDGALHERRIAILMELSDKIYSIADHINAALRSGEANEKSKMRLSQYAYLLMFSCYCEQYFWLELTTASFPQWIDDFPEVKVLVNSIHASHYATEMERITTPQYIESTEIVQWVKNRRGHVLCANMALCSVAKEISVAPATTIPGVVALRQLASDVPIFTCGRVSAEGREDLLYNIRLAFPKADRIIWISLRSEPMVFINGTGYSLVDYSALHSEFESSGDMHISKERLEEIEERLVKDVLQEAHLNGGEVLVHQSKQHGEVEALRIAVNKAATPSSVMDGFAEENSGILYARVPMPNDGTMLPVDIDPLLSFLEQSYNSDDAIVINDTEGAMRTTIALNIATIVRAAQASKKRLREIKELSELQDVLRDGAEHTGQVLSTAKSYGGMEEEETLPTTTSELQIASVVCQMLAAGSMLKSMDLVLRVGGLGAKWNILHAIDIAKNAMPPNDKTSPQALYAVECVRKYLLVLLTGLYVEERSATNATRRNTGDAHNLKFSEWIASLLEIDNILQKLHEKPSRTLKYIVSENLMANTVNRAVDRRSGDVLTANYMMKADHFPGCQKKGLRPQICGAPNFRKVEGVNIFGVAIPTITGVLNVLTTLGACDQPMVAHPNDPNDEQMFLGWATPKVYDPDFNVEELSQPLKGRVVWVNLREEPIIYVGDRPFVFRDMSAPYVNVELTGIEASKVEMVEESLKNDILTEAQQYDGNFLVHDEGKPGELVGIWEPATKETVRTVRQLYKECAADGCRVSFIRMPVTDEQSPEMKDFDALVNSLLPLLNDHRTNHPGETLSFVFNCQMGRGRTTTGMVVCCLLLGIVEPDYYKFLDRRFPELWQANDTELMKGNYQCVSQLRSVLSDGRSAKHRIDLVLEACSKMQNLRTAIEGFATQVTSSDVTEEARGRALHHGVHYLQRYFNLIAFSSYLEEEFDHANFTFRKTFAAWMEERPEIVSLHDAASLQ